MRSVDVTRPVRPAIWTQPFAGHQFKDLLFAGRARGVPMFHGGRHGLENSKAQSRLLTTGYYVPKSVIPLDDEVGQCAQGLASRDVGESGEGFFGLRDKAAGVGVCVGERARGGYVFDNAGNRLI